MFTNLLIPESFSLIKKGKVYLLLNEEYKDLLLEQGIEALEIFLQRHKTSRYLAGRTLHPSVPIRDGEWMVLRQYLHGGFLRGLTRSLYLFGSRSFRELALTEEIRSCGIPTSRPIGAIHRRLFPPFYQAYLLSLEIPRAMDLIQYFQQIGSHPSGENLSLKRKTIRSAGHLLQRFHQAGFFHRDLQLKNLLVAEGQIFLIDFDRSYRKEVLSVKKRMKNLFRLDRSVEKWKRCGLPITRSDRWRFFLAYAGDNIEVKKAVQRSLRVYSVRAFFHRLGWALKDLVRGKMA